MIAPLLGTPTSPEFVQYAFAPSTATAYGDDCPDARVVGAPPLRATFMTVPPTLFVQ
jgi:hypothetical protein